MKRRTFLQTSSTVTLPMLVNGLNVTAITKSPLFNSLDGDDDRILVLLQLNGGNDGLNTLIPLDQYANLVSVRSNVIIPESSILDIGETNGFHPSMGSFKTLYEEDQLSIIQSVGYPNQNRSHFRSTDIWHTASEANEFLSSGWAGRFLDTRHPMYPDNYPNDDYPDPLAITIGYAVSETCQGVSSNYSMAIVNPENLSPLAEGQADDVPDNCYGRELTFVREAIKQTNLYSETVTNAAELGTNLSTKYSENNRLAQQMKTVAQLISGGLKTKIYVVSLGGFDTHAAQVLGGDTTTGTHATLLEWMSDAICAFQDDMVLQGLDHKVVGMTYSEFGRRIRSNESLGTDHGTAAPLFVFGTKVNPGIMGTSPEISPNAGVQDGVPMQFDFRDVYGSILQDWFCVEESVIRDILHPGYTHLSIIDSGSSCFTSTEDIEIAQNFDINIYPNPCSNFTRVSFSSLGDDIKMSLFDVRGYEVKQVANRKFGEGQHELLIEMHDLLPGQYHLRFQSDRGVMTKSFVKI